MDTERLLEIRAAGGHSDRIEHLVRKLDRRFDITLAHRLLLRIGVAIRRGDPAPPAAQAWRVAQTQDDMGVLVADLATRVAHWCSPGLQAGLAGVLRIRDGIESVRVGVRWTCLRRDFEPLDLRGWRALSSAVRRIDAAIAERLRGAAIERPPSFLPDARDPANWLARLGAPLAPAPRRAPDAGAAPRWPAVERYLRRGTHRRRVEGHAAADEAFAILLDVLITRAGGGASAAARAWSARRACHALTAAQGELRAEAPSPRRARASHPA